MSDYLTHLAARTFNQVPVVEPRLPGWFEPPRATGELESAVELNRAPVNEPAAFQGSELETTAPARVPAHPPQETESSPTDTSYSFQSTPLPAEPQPTRITSPRTIQVLLGVAPQVSPERLIPSFQLPTVRLPQPDDSVPASPPRPVLEEIQPASDDSNRPTSLIRQAHSSESPESLARARLEPDSTQPSSLFPPAPVIALPRVTLARYDEPINSASTVSALQPASPATPMPGVTHPRVAPVQSELTPALMPAATPAPTPTIRVTIGRVEVRAVLPATPPARPAAKPAPTPRMSLDDYLRSRKGGAG